MVIDGYEWVLIVINGYIIIVIDGYDWVSMVIDCY